MIDVEKKLKKAEPISLSETEKRDVLRYVKNHIKQIDAQASASYLSINTYKNMKKSLLTKIIATVLIFTGSVATVFASNDARPGDVLFAVDRAIENLQLALTTDDGREAELKLEFAQERLKEVSELIEEFRLANESTEDDSSVASTTATSTPSTTATSTLSTITSDTATTTISSTATSTSSYTFEAEADVFTDITIVKVELENSSKEIFETSVKTRDEVVDEIVIRFSLARDEVDAVLNFEVEDRASRSDDRELGGTDNAATDDNNSNTSNNSNDNNIGIATSIALNFLGDIKNDFVLSENEDATKIVDELMEQFQESLNNLPNDVSVKIDLDQNKDRIRFEIKSDDHGNDKIRLKVDKNKIEFRDGDSKLKIKIRKDGRLKIDIRNDKSHDDNDDNNELDDLEHKRKSGDNDHSDDKSKKSSKKDHSNIKIRAKIKGHKTKIEVKIDGDKDKFTLETTTREEIVSHVSSVYGISTSSIDSIIDFDE